MLLPILGILSRMARGQHTRQQKYFTSMESRGHSSIRRWASFQHWCAWQGDYLCIILFLCNLSTKINKLMIFRQSRDPWNNGHMVTMVASITMASLSIWSTWMNMWVSREVEIIKSAQQPQSAKLTIQKAEIANVVQEMAWRAPSPPPLGGATRKSMAGGVAQGITSVFSLYSPSTHAKTGRYSA